MSNGGRSAALLAPIAFAFMSIWSNPSPPAPITHFSYISPYQISTNGRALQVAAGNETDYNVDISGLRVNLKCAENVTFSSINSIRLDLLRQGCAQIIGGPLDSAEKNAQAQAQANHVGFWAQSSGIGKFLQWIKTHKLISYPGIILFLAILSSPLLLKFGRWIYQLFYKRKVKIIIAGVAAAGKTGLWKAWRDEYAVISKIDPTVGMEPAGIEPVTLEKWTLRPTLIDAAGGEAWYVLQEIQGARGLVGIIGRITRRRTKRVLVYVVAPSPQEEATVGAVFDESYVVKQEGYAYLPMAIIKQNDPKIRPDLVMMFATKFDLLSKISPNDADGNEVAELERVFESHRKLVESACTAANIPFVWIVGSAKRGWNIDKLRKGLGKLIDNV